VVGDSLGTVASTPLDKDSRDRRQILESSQELQWDTELELHPRQDNQEHQQLLKSGNKNIQRQFNFKIY